MADEGAIWLPPGVAATPEASPIRRRNPFERITRNVRAMGFEIKARVDQEERVAEVLFVPTTSKAKAAVRTASGSAEADGLKTLIHYRDTDTPFHAVVACIQKGLEELKQAL